MTQTKMKVAFLSAAFLAATPVLAQDDATQAAGAVMGGIVAFLIIIAIGAVVGWLASLIVKGSGSGFWGDVLIGIGGSFLGGWLLPLLGVHFGGLVGSLVGSVIGAVVLILVIRMIRKAAS